MLNPADGDRIESSRRCCANTPPAHDNSQQPHQLRSVPIPRNALTALLLVAVLTASASAEDWPRFLGPRGDNTSAEINLLDHWNPNGPPIIWEKSVGAGYSAPSVSKDLLVLHHRLGNEEIVEAMDARSGKSK